jgi:L-asparaginase
MHIGGRSSPEGRRSSEVSEAPLVRLLTTGGTIATVRDQAGRRTVPALRHDELARLATTGDSVRIRATELLRLPSWSIGIDEMLAVARAVRDAVREEGVAGVVVTHGTTKLEYTAFLTDLVVDTGVPVVFTGAMRRADDADADGPVNLRDAIQVAAAPDFRECGVLVCFAGRVMSARSVWKRDRNALDAFEDLHGPVGRVSDGSLLVLRRPAGRRLVLDGRVERRVGIVKAWPDADGSVVEALVGGGAVGLVVEALPGVGGVPPRMQPVLRDAAAANVMVVIASRAPVGHVPDPPTGGTGEPLLGQQLISAGNLTAEQAWVLLSLALGQYSDFDALQNVFRVAATTASGGHI